VFTRSPEITCDDGSEPKLEDDLPPPEDLLRDLTFEYDPESDILINYSPLEHRRIGAEDQAIYNGFTLVWGRAEAEKRIGDMTGWITYGDNQGVWARDLTSSRDPADRVHLSSTSGTPIGWSPDGSKLLVQRDINEPGLSVVNSDGTETRLTDGNESTDGGSFSPDGTAVVYAEGGRIYVMDADGGSPQLLLAPGGRRYPDEPGRFETMLQEPQWSPDGSQIAYFDGMGDWGHSLRVMDSDGTASRVVVENGETLGAGHVNGLQWSPDGSRLAFSIEGRIYVVGVDGSGFRPVTDDGVEPYWSPDGSHIAYRRPDPEGPSRGSLEIVRLDDLQAQNFGDGGSGPWTPEVSWTDAR
jgi:Tol biopolymer transport system component